MTDGLFSDSLLSFKGSTLFVQEFFLKGERRNTSPNALGAGFSLPPLYVVYLNFHTLQSILRMNDRLSN